MRSKWSSNAHGYTCKCYLQENNALMCFRSNLLRSVFDCNFSAVGELLVLDVRSPEGGRAAAISSSALTAP